MKKSILMFGALCMMIMMQACGDTSLWPIEPLDPKDPGNGGGGGNNNAQLIGREWKLKSFEEINVGVRQIIGQSYTLKFTEDGQASGTAFCNGYGGSYTLGASNSMSMSAFITTDMFCGDDSHEGEYIDALLQSRSYTVTDNSLRIYYDNGTRVLNFDLSTETPVDPNPGTSIKDVLGMQWRLVSMEVTNDMDLTKTLIQVPNDQQFLLKFDANTQNKLSGLANCNSYHGQYESHDNSTLRIQDIASTKVNCNVANTLEDDYYNALEAAHSYVLSPGAVNGGLMIFYGGSYNTGQNILYFAPVSKDPNNYGNEIEDILDVTYRLVEYGSVNGVMTPVDPAVGPAPTFKFLAGGTFSGTSVCSAYYGSYELGNSSSAISFKNFVGAPDNGCPVDETELFDALRDISHYTIAPGVLDLYYDGGRSALRFVRE